MIPPAIYIFILIELAIVSYLDIKFRKIKNYWSLLNLTLAVIFFIAFPGIYHLKLETFGYPVVFFFVGFVLFLLKIMGGGDSKFLSTFFLIVPTKAHDEVFIHLLMATVIVGSLFFLANIFRNFEGILESFRDSNIKGVKNYFGKKFAYAPVILFSWISFGIFNLL